MPIDKRLIEALQSKDPAQRKKAIMHLTKSLDEAALPYLAKVAKTDSSPELRELALKGGRYIRKNAAPPSYDDTLTDYDSQSYSAYGPSNRTSSGNKKVDDALNYYVTGQYTQANAMLRQAFREDRSLSHNPEAVKAAVQITGMAADDAVKFLTADPKNGNGAKRKRRALPGFLSAETITFLCVLVMIGGALLLAASATQSWMSISQYEITIPDSDYTAMDIASDKDIVATYLSIPEAIETIITLLMSGQGVNPQAFINPLTGEFQRSPLSYSMFLVPANAAIILLMSIFVLAGRRGPFYWLGVLVFAGLAGFAFYWFSDALNDFNEMLLSSSDIDVQAVFGLTGMQFVREGGYDLGLLALGIMGVAGGIGLVSSLFLEPE